jgi:hypothetical protein
VKKDLPPDTRHEPVYQNELTLEVTYSPTKMRRSVITRDSNGRFRARRQRWDAAPGHWHSDERGFATAVSLETARALAEEKLKEAPDRQKPSTP